MTGRNGPTGIIRAILAFIVSNIIMITCVITLSIACATIVIWFGDRERYWR